MTTSIIELIYGIELEGSLNGSRYSREDIRRAINAADIKGVIVKTDATPNVDIEIVFPPLAWCEFSKHYIKKVLDILNEHGVSVNRHCGFHVHIGNAPLKDTVSPTVFCGNSAVAFDRDNNISSLSNLLGETFNAVIVKDIMQRYSSSQYQINSMFPTSRTHNSYCRTLNEVITGDTIEALAANTSGKFSVINLQTWSRGTIEFRQASATFEFDKIVSWVEFLLTLVAHTIDNRVELGDASQEFTTPEMPFRNSYERNAITYTLIRRNGGASTQEIMDATGRTDQAVRRSISEIRSRLSAQGFDATRAVIQHDQATYGNRYGSGTHLNGYEVVREYETLSTGARLMPDNRIGGVSIWASISDELFSWWQERIAYLNSVNY